MGTKIASLEIELAMATGQFASDLNAAGGLVDKVSAQAIRDLNKIDDAMKNVGGLDAATASVVNLASETAKSKIAMAREFAQIERSGEAMAAKLERQLSVFGKSATEIRAMKAETAALAAEQKNMGELADRIRAAEQALFDAEYAASRRARQEQEAATEARAIAAAAAEKEAIAVRQAAEAYQLFEARARDAMQVYKDQQAVDAAAAKEREALALRDASIAYQQFEARARAGANAMREADAATARDAATVARLREMLDPAAAAQARMNHELEEARRVMTAAGASGDELSRVHTMLSRTGGNVVASAGQMKAGMQQLSYNLNDVATMWAMGSKPMQIFASQGRADHPGHPVDER